MSARWILFLFLFQQAFCGSEAERESFVVAPADLSGRILEQSRATNHRNAAVDHYLSERKIELPKRDYILIAYQPSGIVSSCLIVDLQKRLVRILPGTHGQGEEKAIDLAKGEFDYLTELVSSDLMKNFPSQSGNFGLDGYSLVVYARSSETERFISHWKPEYLGLDLFRSVHAHFLKKFSKPARATSFTNKK